LRLWPVYVLLREYAAHGLPAAKTIWEFVCQELTNNDLAGFIPFLQDQMQTGTALVILDGLDEVEQSDQKPMRDSLRQEIIKFVDAFPQVRVIVTSRPYAYGAHWYLSDFETLRLLPFDDGQIKMFIHNWYTVKKPERVDQLTQDFVREVDKERDEQLHELATQPLLLTMMALIHYGQEGTPLPKKRAELYRACIVLLLERWQKSKVISGRKADSLLDVLGIDQRELLDRLAKVAYEAHKQQPENKGTADIPGDLLAGALLGDLKIERTARETVGVLTQRGLLKRKEMEKKLEGRVGLLSEHGRNPQDTANIYRFPHRSFQEYLAGRHFLLDDNYPQQLVADCAHDPDKWREVVLLAAGIDPAPRTIWPMVNSLCSTDPPPTITGRESAAKLAFLAARVLLETNHTAPDPDSDLGKVARPRIQQWQRAIVSKGWLKPDDRALAGEALAALGDDRPGILTCDEMVFCAVPAGPFWLANWDEKGQGVVYDGLDKPYWIGRYPVTAAQFKKFLKDKPDHTAYGRERIEKLPDNWPVVWVNWYDALAFANWLDERWRKKNLLPDGYRVMLPNEVEWEKAARGGLEIPPEPLIMTAANLKNYQRPQMAENELYRRTYPWDSEREQEGDLYRANNKAAGIGQPCAVGSFPAGASPYGCLDLSGQVWEWTRSYYGQKFPYRAGEQYETIDDRNKETMVLRGGSFYKDQNACSACSASYPHHYLFDLGLRLVVGVLISHR
jgi:formylglycine-generating enzyme required for sulfatase activity